MRVETAWQGLAKLTCHFAKANLQLVLLLARRRFDSHAESQLAM